MEAIISERSQKRKPNWTDTEQVLMLDLYSKYIDVLGSKLYTAINCRDKIKCWCMITEQLNDLNPSVHRTVEEVKRKWHNLLGQGRRDYLDWKRAKEDPHLTPVSIPALSRRALELHGGFKLDDCDTLTEEELTEMPDEEEFIYLQAGHESTRNELDESSDAEVQELPEIKQECPSPVSSEDDIEDLMTSSVAKSQPPSRSNSSQSATLSVRAVNSASPSAISGRTQVNMASPQLSLAPQMAGHRNIQSSATLGSNRPSVSSSPVALVTAGHNAASSLSSSLKESLPSLTVRGSNQSHPSEPPWKKLRGSEFGQGEMRSSSLQSDRGEEPQLERRAGQYSEREAELRIDILQLEKDKLWLETEKLRLEIDILRKKKQQMNF